MPKQARAASNKEGSETLLPTKHPTISTRNICFSNPDSRGLYLPPPPPPLAPALIQIVLILVVLCSPPPGGEGRGEEGEAGAGQLAATDQGPGRQGQDTGQVHEANLEEIWTYSLTNLLYVRTMHLRTYTEQ